MQFQSRLLPAAYGWQSRYEFSQMLRGSFAQDTLPGVGEETHPQQLDFDRLL